MPVTVYRSTDASAPVLNGTAGKGYALLKACLVTGYGAKAAAGWAEAFSDVNKGAFRAPSGKRHYFRVDDTNPEPEANNRECYVRGYEAMTAIDTGTGPFPTTTQAAVGGCVLRNSASADSIARPWIVVADARTCYAFVKSGDYIGYSSIGFGEFYALGGANDAYNSFIAGSITRQGTGTGEVQQPNPANETFPLFSALNVVTAGHYVPRAFMCQDIQAAVTFGKHGDAANSATSMIGLLEYPNRPDGGLHLAQIWVAEVNTGGAMRRGRMRGLWHFLHPQGCAINDGDTFSGTGPLAGKTFLIIKPTATGAGVFVLETSDTWETN